MEMLKNPFSWGLLLGLLLAGFVLKSALTGRRHARAEIKRLSAELKELQGHLNTQLKINASGNAAVHDELERLRQQNENLRVNNAALQQKAGRAELRQLQVYEIAIRAMREQAPGFAQAWERVLREAEADVEAADGGLKKLIRKVVSGISGPSVPPSEDKGES